MADHHTHHNPLGQDALFTTPASLMLDARPTPLERNGNHNTQAERMRSLSLAARDCFPTDEGIVA